MIPPVTSQADHPREPFDALPPVPAAPLHVCPGCRYVLTGLTTRRCPECGAPFTLRDARSAAQGGKGSFAREDIRAIRVARICLIAGAVMLIAGFGMPAVLSERPGATLAVMMGFFAPALLVGLLLRGLLDVSRHIIIVLLGLIALYIGGMRLMIMYY